MKVIRTTIKGKSEVFKALTVDQAAAELLISHPTNTGEELTKALLKGTRMQGAQGRFYQLDQGYQGENGEYKDSESKQKRKKKGLVVKPEDNETTCTPEGLAQRLNTTSFNVRKAVRSLGLKRKGKYWAWDKVVDKETIDRIITALTVAEAPKPKVVKKMKVKKVVEEEVDEEDIDEEE